MSSPSAHSSTHSPPPFPLDDDAHPEASTSYAPYKPIPKMAYSSVEYPSTVSHPSAILRLISQEDINECFNKPMNNPALLEVRFGGLDRPSAIPIRGNRMPSQKLLLKVTKRRRRKGGEETVGQTDKGKEPERPGSEEGIFVSEVVGPISQTVRFRCGLHPVWHGRSCSF